MDYYIPSDASWQAKVNMAILRALLKYGLNSFTLLVLPIQDSTRKSLLEFEQKLIDKLLPEYNILSQAGSFSGHTHTEEACSNMSKAKVPRSQRNRDRAKSTLIKTFSST